MNYDHLFKQYAFSPQKAQAYGFEPCSSGWRLRKPLCIPDFYVMISIGDGTAETQVYELTGGEMDGETGGETGGEPYLPYNVSVENGAFVSSVRSEVDGIMDEVVKNCFELTDVRSLLLRYVKEKYGTEPESPWGEYEGACTLNTAVRHKWYGLFMLIPYRSLGIDAPGKINVLNIKLSPERIAEITDSVRYFPAYHMNKKHWITVLLDRNADTDEISRLLDESYDIVEHPPKHKKNQSSKRSCP